MNAKKWLLGWGLASLSGILMIVTLVCYTDPYFHYHEPYTDRFYYELNNERSQNDGIMRHFTYDALITGSSMTENFKTSEIDQIYGVTSIKVPYAGATFYELKRGVETALREQSQLGLVIIGIDMARYMDEKNLLREDLGEYPEYLYDDQIWNDCYYVLNRDVISRMVHMVFDSICGKQSGITSFDEYASFAGDMYGAAALKEEFTKCLSAINPMDERDLTDCEKTIIQENVDTNLVSIAQKYPEVDFYVFIPPYSILWWTQIVEEGRLNQQLEAEQIIIDQLLLCDNIHLYSFNLEEDLITNLDNYKDILHYGPWVNSQILEWMNEEKGRITRGNYKNYILSEKEFFEKYDYDRLKKTFLDTK